MAGKPYNRRSTDVVRQLTRWAYFDFEDLRKNYMDQFLSCINDGGSDPLISVEESSPDYAIVLKYSNQKDVGPD